MTGGGGGVVEPGGEGTWLLIKGMVCNLGNGSKSKNKSSQPSHPVAQSVQSGSEEQKGERGGIWGGGGGVECECGRIWGGVSTDRV